MIWLSGAPGDALLTLTRGQETELPASAKLRFMSAEDDYQQAVAEARRLTGASGRVAQADLPIVLDDGLSGAIAETWLFETWAARERAEFTLPPSALALEPGDVVACDVGRADADSCALTDISEHGVREIEARSIDADVYDRVSLPGRVTGAKAARFKLARRQWRFSICRCWMQQRHANRDMSRRCKCRGREASRFMRRRKRRAIS